MPEEFCTESVAGSKEEDSIRHGITTAPASAAIFAVVKL
jgi:hypothetical protein